MPKKVLIAYDGSECSNAALDDLNFAGLGDDVEARVVSVAEVWLPPAAQGETEISAAKLNVKTVALLDEAKRLTTHAAKKVAADFPKWKVSSIVRSGSPAWEVVLLSDEWKPDLVVVGSQGQNALSRALLGSVSRRVLAEARCSVRIARSHHSSGEAAKILIGVDGSEGSQAAVKEVGRRLWRKPTEVRIMLFDDPFVPSFISEFVPSLSATGTETKEEQSWAEQVLRDCESCLNLPNVKLTTEIREGNPKNDLPHLAEEWGADCIFVGSTGFSSRLERFVLGSVSDAVASRSSCSVEVVRMNAPVSLLV